MTTSLGWAAAGETNSPRTMASERTGRKLMASSSSTERVGRGGFYWRAAASVKDRSRGAIPPSPRRGSRRGQVAVVLGPAVARERHPRARFGHVLQIDLGQHHLVAVGLGPGHDLAAERGDHDRVADVGQAVLDACLADADVEEPVL